MTQEDVTLENGKLKRMSYGYDQFNNVTSMVERDLGTGGSAGGVLRRTERVYATTINGYCYTGLNAFSGSCASTSTPDTSSIIHQRRLMLSETIKDGGGTAEAISEIEYDNYAGANHAPLQANAGMTKYNNSRFASFNASFQPRGNVTSVRRWIVGSSYVTSYTQYDEAGQVVKAIDPLGRATTISYTDNFGDGANPDFGTYTPAEPTYAMTTKVTNALGHVVKMQWDYTRGSATGVKDANGVIAKTEYNDVYDRPTKVTTGNGLSGSETAISEMSYPTPGPNGNEMKSSRQLDSTRWLSSRTQYDGFGRPKKVSQSEEGLHYSSASFTIHAETKYDGLGRAVKATNPYRGAGGASTDGWTRSVYDLAGRVTEVATFSGGPTSPPPDSGTNANWTGSVITSYNGEVTTVRDQANKQRRSTIDGLGRLKTVEELFETGALYATTSYSYDARGNLKQVNQGSQVRTFSYDGLSRLTSASNPESGSVSYSYDLNSNLRTKTDARPVTTTYFYDELNRVTLRDYSDTTADVSYVYDPLIPNGKAECVKGFETPPQRI